MHRPLARRVRLVAPALLVVAALPACRSGFQISPISEGMTSETLLGCVAEVAEQNGLPVIEQRPDAAEPTLWARSTDLESAATADAAAPRRVDVLTVSFRKLGHGLKVLAQTFDLRQGAPAAAPAALVRPAGRTANDDTDGTLWHATAPSLRVAEARDSVLARCGSLGR
ncbi:hypothetical protein [Roseisolibacter sp. H3M3-2]|uniref:hypothetical protein n=1 Tax=Roseisolibacter sp. H3M3-2 TaxID=3031323 RepID=UPI0023DC3D41|nr:hypothetical protein [Roseisolibacter sp. H3M3-2]MDF1502669.1 hypothetical protein [Roseisolibacter sp. H3M3-2]